MQYPYSPNYRDQSSRVMTVTGAASVMAEPNIVHIQLEVVTEVNELRKAQEENAHTVNQVIAALLKQEVDRKDIQTASYNISPKYDYVDGKQVFRGYQVSHVLRVTLHDIEKAGAVIDTAVKNGVNRVSNIDFTVDNEQPYYQQALTQALNNASAKAKAMADALQVNLDPTPIKIVEETSEAPVVYKTMAVTEASYSTPIEPGQISIEANVKVKYRYSP